jgi:hypothetical protein
MKHYLGRGLGKVIWKDVSYEKCIFGTWNMGKQSA